MPISMSDSQVLERAVEILDERGWCQGTAMLADGRVCAGQALHMALTGENWASYDWGVGDGQGRFKELAKVIVTNSDLMTLKRVTFWIPSPGGDGEVAMEALAPPAIHYWNDEQIASVEDVKLAFKKSIEQLQAEGR